MGWDHCVGISIYPKDGLRSVVDDGIQKLKSIFINTNVQMKLKGSSSRLHVKVQSISNDLTEGSEAVFFFFLAERSSTIFEVICIFNHFLLKLYFLAK